MSYTAEFHHRVYARLQRVAVASGRNSAQQLLREVGGRTYRNTIDHQGYVWVDPRVRRAILPKLERLWGTRKGYY